MSRSLRVAHLPSMQPLVRFSGYLTTPHLTDTQVAGALAPFLINLQLWRSIAELPADWLVRDDSLLQNPMAWGTPVWGQGNDVSASTVIGNPETPWRLLVGDGQLVIANVWLYDPQADPWPPAASDSPRYALGVSAPAAPTAPSTGAVGGAIAIAAVVASAAALWWQSRRA
jgi:hypothetical protein